MLIQQMLVQFWQHLVVVPLALSRAHMLCRSCCWTYLGCSSQAGGTGLYCQHQCLEQMWQLCVQVLIALCCVTQCVVLADGSIVVVAVAAFGAAAAVCAKKCSHVFTQLLLAVSSGAAVAVRLNELQQLLVIAASVQMPLFVVLMTALGSALCDTWLLIMQVAARQIKIACCYLKRQPLVLLLVAMSRAHTPCCSCCWSSSM